MCPPNATPVTVPLRDGLFRRNVRCRGPCISQSDDCSTVALGKPFDLMVYPNRSHCICEGPGTTLHLYRLLARYLFEHLDMRALP